MVTPSDSPLDFLCERLEQHHYLEPECHAALHGLDFEVRTFRAGSLFVRTEQRVKSCALLISGVAYRSKTVSTGERQILAVHVPGDLIDLQNLLMDVADHDVRILTNATLAIFPRDLLGDIAFRFPSVGKALWHDSLVEQSIYREWLTNIGRRSALTRIAHLLCELCCRLEHTQFSFDQGFELPMSQEQIGDCLGLTGVHVNRMLRQLETMHLINRTKRSIHIADWHSLQLIGDFTPEYLHFPVLNAA